MAKIVVAFDSSEVHAAAADFCPVLLVGFDEKIVRQLQSLNKGSRELLWVEQEKEAFRLLTSRRIGVLCLGQGLAPPKVNHLLEKIDRSAEDVEPLVLSFTGTIDSSRYRERVYYSTQEPPAVADQLELLLQAAAVYDRRMAEMGESTSLSQTNVLLETLQRLALQEDFTDMAELLASASVSIIKADTARCLLYDPQEEVLWAVDPRTGGEQRVSASAGIVGFVLRIGRQVAVQKPAEDSRFAQASDDPWGDGTGPFVAVPLKTLEDQVFGVLVALRNPGSPSFFADEVKELHYLAKYAAPYFSKLVESSSPWRMNNKVQRPVSLKGPQEVFRQTAVEAWAEEDQEHGDPLRISPLWIRSGFQLLLALLLLGLIFLCLAQVDDYAAGTAVVRSGSRLDLSVKVAGFVDEVMVNPGERVEPGQVLVRFAGTGELDELNRLEREFNLLLVKRLRNPSDTGTENALVGLRAQRELAAARLDELVLRAPMNGTVSDLWVRQGRYLLPGQVALSLIGHESHPYLMILVPGEYRPQLRPGLDLRFEIDGYPHSYQHLQIKSVSDEVVGAREALRFLGPEWAATEEIKGSVALVEVNLPSSTFEVAGREYRYHEGMAGTAEIRVRRESAILTLIPGLRALVSP